MNTKSVLTTSFLIFNLSLPALAEDVPEEIIIEAKRETGGSTSSSGSVGGTQNQPFSKAGGMNSGPGRAEAAAAEAAAAEIGKKLDACGAKKQRINTLTNTYLNCNNNTQGEYNARLGNCPEVVQVGSTWGLKTKDGTTWGYSRERAQNEGEQCRKDADSIYTKTILNVCTANFNAEKSAEGELSQFCKDAGF